MICVRQYEWMLCKNWNVEGWIWESRSRENHSRSGILVSGHTRMALGNTRMRWSGTRMALGNTRMDEEDDVLNVVWSLLVRVWGSGTRSIRVWDRWYAYGLGEEMRNTRMRVGITRMDSVRRGQYAYGHRQYAYGQNCGLSWTVVEQFLLFRLSEVT